MDKQYITLISYGHFEKDFLATIAECITHEYSYPVSFDESYLDLSKFYDPARHQYDANKLLKEIDSKIEPDAFKTLGLFRVDLFIPILTYIYGQAFLNGRTGIVSLHRLKNELYGLSTDENLLTERFKKIVIHELGHTFGLKHCHTPACVMLSSTYVEDIDQKNVSLCAKCKKEIVS